MYFKISAWLKRVVANIQVLLKLCTNFPPETLREHLFSYMALNGVIKTLAQQCYFYIINIT